MVEGVPDRRRNLDRERMSPESNLRGGKASQDAREKLDSTTTCTFFFSEFCVHGANTIIPWNDDVTTTDEAEVEVDYNLDLKASVDDTHSQITTFNTSPQ